jgi:hypothetical protein
LLAEHGQNPAGWFQLAVAYKHGARAFCPLARIKFNVAGEKVGILVDLEVGTSWQMADRLKELRFDYQPDAGGTPALREIGTLEP